MTNQDIEKQKKNSKLIKIFLLIIVLLFLLLLLTDKSTNKHEPKNSKRYASMMAQDFMKQRLKSPSTADFPLASQASVSVAGDIFEVSSYVDAQNSFGAKTRTFYKAKLRYDASSDKWYLLDLKTE